MQRIVTLLMISSNLFGCASTRTETISAPYCTEDVCEPHNTFFTKTYGPISLQGGLSIGNLPNLAAFGQAFNSAHESAGQELLSEVKEYSCGPNCQKEITWLEKLRILPCPMLGASAARGAEQIADQASAECRAKNPDCNAIAIEISSDSTKLETDQQSVMCTIKLSSDISVTCGKGSGKISNPTIFGEWSGTIKCTQDNQCPVTGATTAEGIGTR
jgi:hypothetical protein